jgi:hypothetical protein
MSRVAPVPGFSLPHRNHTVRLVTDVDVRAACERDLEAAGVGIPLPYRSEWAALSPRDVPWFLAAYDDQGCCVCGLGLRIIPSRVWPGSLAVRAERVGPAVAPGALESALHGLAALARRDRRILWAELALFSQDQGFHRSAGATARAVGFRPRRDADSYRYTLAIDLAPDEEALFASLHATARRHVRAVSKRPVAVRLIDTPDLSRRLEVLLGESFARRGSRARPKDWPAVIRLCQTHPGLSRLVGLFRTDVAGPESLVAFAWGRRHGDHVEYATAGSARAPELRMPLGYALAWDLIAWAKRSGATWFDFGGVTLPGKAEDPLAGISDFKRYFSDRVAEVGTEWELETRFLPARVARTARAGARLLRRMVPSLS